MLGNLKLRNYYYLVSEYVNYLILYLFTFGEICEVFIPSLIMFGCFIWKIIVIPNIFIFCFL